MSRLPTAYRSEAACVSRALSELAAGLDWAAAAQHAHPWVQAVRRNPPPFWAMESLLKEYPISSAEGLALMRLAESLLRVPDAETAIALTADQLSRADFDGTGDSALARLSSSAIVLSKKFLPNSPNSTSLTTKLGARTVVAATLRAVQLLGHQFVLGRDIGEALRKADTTRKDQTNTRFSYDMLGEGARTQKDADRYMQSYTHAIQCIASNVDQHSRTEQRDGISIKLSALHPRYEDAQRERVLAELVPRVWQLCVLAADAQINLTIDAEEVDRLELSLEVFEVLVARVAADKPDWRGFGLAMQAYQTRALDLMGHVIGLGRKYKLRLMCRLVKGAYWDAEIKRAQELGLPHYPVFTHKHHTDINYLACAKVLLDAPDAVYPQFATHNAGTIAAILQMASRKACPFELQRLHGMGEGIYREVLANPLIACRVYAPVGAHRELLAYLVRRLLENGANSSFVHQLADESVGMDELLISPLRLEAESSLPLPPAIFGPGRPNSTGVDLTDESMRAPLLEAYQQVQVLNTPDYPVENIAAACSISLSSYRKWSKTGVEQRADMLRAAATTLDAQMPRFAAMLVKEAFKTWGDAVSEVREAVDFLRYYALEAERIMQPIELPQACAGMAFGVTGESNRLRLTGRGPWVCISPWNFPLAIFMGQVAAALATGNTVLAKPAEQTPGIAMAAVQLLHQAGVPADALQLLSGPGETVGAALVAAPEVAGVVFTGSTQVAKIIQRTLAAKDGPIVPFIAETGGINAMVVDSTALPEQVTDAVIQSAFRSAGQRCSALRLLVLHESIADTVVEMIQGAAAELVCGTPMHLATDVGPVIDRDAFVGIQAHIQKLESGSWDLLASGRAGATVRDSEINNLISPRAFEVPRIDAVHHEIFGPVLHVARWGSGEMADPEVVIEAINRLGYGLTLGIQTRIDSRATLLAQAAHVGNVYVNRNTIGAVVGLQPFGGEGLSGTGPKAGGPHYLYRFCAEQTVCLNTTAAGGNVSLMNR